MKCFICQTDSFIFCSLCKRSFCPEHKCFHIGDLDQDDFLSEKSNNEVGPEGAYYQSDDYTMSDRDRDLFQQNRDNSEVVFDKNKVGEKRERADHWLSNRVIFSSLSEAKLLSEKKRYQTLIRLIEEELRSRYSPTFNSNNKKSQAFIQTRSSNASISGISDRKIEKLVKNAKRLGILSKIMEMLK